MELWLHGSTGRPLASSQPAGRFLCCVSCIYRIVRQHGGGMVGTESAEEEKPWWILKGSCAWLVKKALDFGQVPRPQASDDLQCFIFSGEKESWFTLLIPRHNLWDIVNVAATRGHHYVTAVGRAPCGCAAGTEGVTSPWNSEQVSALLRTWYTGCWSFRLLRKIQDGRRLSENCRQYLLLLWLKKDSGWWWTAYEPTVAVLELQDQKQKKFEKNVGFIGIASDILLV